MKLPGNVNNDVKIIIFMTIPSFLRDEFAALQKEFHLTNKQLYVSHSKVELCNVNSYVHSLSHACLPSKGGLNNTGLCKSTK